MAASVEPRLTAEGQAPAEEASRAVATSMDLRSLFEAHYPAIWRLLRRLGVHPAHVDDAAQEVFWVAARRLGDIHEGRERSFLHGVALRIAGRAVRKQRDASPLIEPDDLGRLLDEGPSPEDQLEQRRARALLDRVLDRMTADLRTVFVLFELEGLEVREIAALEEIPVGTASSRLRRAREEFSTLAQRIAAVTARGRGQ
jgi:RNA polymerase sigma-70 factor, ECF subfamily